MFGFIPKARKLNRHATIIGIGRFGGAFHASVNILFIGSRLSDEARTAKAERNEQEGYMSHSEQKPTPRSRKKAIAGV